MSGVVCQTALSMDSVFIETLKIFGDLKGQYNKDISI
jgi:hypothetical protein